MLPPLRITSDGISQILEKSAVGLASGSTPAKLVRLRRGLSRPTWPFCLVTMRMSSCDFASGIRNPVRYWQFPSPEILPCPGWRRIWIFVPMYRAIVFFATASIPKMSRTFVRYGATTLSYSPWDVHSRSKNPLIEAGLPLRHWDDGSIVSMYLTNIDCAPAGRFHGKMVTSMRPFTPSDAIKAVQITSRYPSVHGAPVHIGLPEMIGIEDVSKAWQGDDPVIGDDELPVFWACGVTPQSVVRSARPPICITHTPASMLVTDLRNASLSVG